jgi:hypothetical protein
METFGAHEWLMQLARTNTPFPFAPSPHLATIVCFEEYSNVNQTISPFSRS